MELSYTQKLLKLYNEKHEREVSKKRKHIERKVDYYLRTKQVRKLIKKHILPEMEDITFEELSKNTIIKPNFGSPDVRAFILQIYNYEIEFKPN